VLSIGVLLLLLLLQCTVVVVVRGGSGGGGAAALLGCAPSHPISGGAVRAVWWRVWCCLSTVWLLAGAMVLPPVVAPCFSAHSQHSLRAKQKQAVAVRRRDALREATVQPPSMPPRALQTPVAAGRGGTLLEAAGTASCREARCNAYPRPLGAQTRPWEVGWAALPSLGSVHFCACTAAGQQERQAQRVALPLGSGAWGGGCAQAFCEARAFQGV